jgi:tetratricopeptide (TPR) repeat protein
MMSTELLATALRYHQGGDFQSAEQLFRQILDTDPSQAEVWNYLGEACLLRGRFAEAISSYQHAVDLVPRHAPAQNGLGVAYAQQNKWDRAVSCFRQATQSQPNYVEAYNNLGIALSNQGKLAEAQRCYQEALRINPNYAEAHSNLGLVLGSMGKLAEAIDCHQRALQIRPDFAAAYDNLQKALAAQDQLRQQLANFRMGNWYLTDEAAAYNELGIALKAQGRLTEAATSFQEALRFRPDMPGALNNLGITFQERGNIEEAEASLRQALALAPGEVNALNNLGTVLDKVGKAEEAIGCYREALRINADFAEAHNNLGNALCKLDKNSEAQAHYQRAIDLKPDYAQAHHNLGSVLLDQGYVEEGLAGYERAIRLSPDYAESHFGRAQVWLKMGDFERGWPELEWRWRRKEFPPRPFSQPLWDGSPLMGRTILLHAEQGLGDTIHFIRFAPLVKQYGGRVIVECQESLLPLLATCPGIDQLVAKDTPLPPFDTHAPLLTLPAILRTTLDTIPADIPYVFADPGLVENWRKEIDRIPAQGANAPRSDHLKIGIAWQGNPAYPNDRRRSVPLARFERLAKLERVRLFSLQRGPGTEQLANSTESFSIADLGNRFQSFQDTAAAIKNLDLVISVDSAVAHCAGALGAPVWVLVPFACDWRWLLHREDSPWYPTMRLFRQPKPGDWTEVLDRITDGVVDRSSQLGRRPSQKS